MRQNMSGVIGSLLKRRQENAKAQHEKEVSALPHHTCLRALDPFPTYCPKKHHSYTSEGQREICGDDENQTLGLLVMAAAGVATLSKVNSFIESREDSLQYDGQDSDQSGESDDDTLSRQHRPYLNERDRNMESSFSQSFERQNSTTNGPPPIIPKIKGPGDPETEVKDEKDGNPSENNKNKDKIVISYSLIYFSLVLISIGSVFIFVGLGEKGYRTTPVAAFGPILFFVGIFILIIKVVYCSYPSIFDLPAYYNKKKRIRPQEKGDPLVNMNMSKDSMGARHTDMEKGMMGQGQMANGAIAGPSVSNISTIEIVSPPLRKVVILDSPKIVRQPAATVAATAVPTFRPNMNPTPKLKSPLFQGGFGTSYDIVDDDVLTRSWVSQGPFGSPTMSMPMSMQSHLQSQPQFQQEFGLRQPVTKNAGHLGQFRGPITLN